MLNRLIAPARLSLVLTPASRAHQDLHTLIDGPRGKRKKVSTRSRLFGYKRGLTSKFNTSLKVLGGRAFLVCAGSACLLGLGMPPATGGQLDSRPQTRAQLRRTLTFAERAAYQYAIEEVYWRHRIWPRSGGENPDPKPSLDAVMSQAQLEKKVADYLRKSQALEDYWQRPITAKQLQAEMDRMAQQTKQPEVLRELFAALGNDPFVIAECLSRPALAERLLTNWYACDQRFHGELKQRAEVDLRAHNTVEQMKQTSGKYSEIELVGSDSVEGEKATATRSVSLREWNRVVQKLAAMFGGPNNQNTRTARFRQSVADANSLVKGAPMTQIKTGVLSPLQEDATRCYATAVLEKTQDRLKLATIAWPKEPLESWLARAENQPPNSAIAVSTKYMLPAIGAGACSDDTWTDTYAGPAGRLGHTAVWTGSEMIVWGGGEGGADIGTGWRYNPSTDAWTPTSVTNAASPRLGHTAVWTGSQMIVWGGQYWDGSNTHYLDTGARYSPITDSWTGMSSNPAGRVSHTAVWTGNEMIIWGGYGGSGYLNTGGRYNPDTDIWLFTSTANAPSGRSSHTAVWSGSEMIIWGGLNSGGTNTGGRYNPSTNSWIATTNTNAPSARYSHTGVWSGSEMIVWGGTPDNFSDVNTGGRYNPSTDSWLATNITNAPDARSQHVAVWSGVKMIVWGGAGASGYLNSGAKYNPNTDSWAATTPTNAPLGRHGHTAIWSGNEMIVWGGFTWPDGQINTGGRYDPATDSWTATFSTPKQRDSHTAVWTGSEMIVWGGIDNFQAFQNTGGRYNPSIDSWLTTSTINAPSPRENHTAVWIGGEMIVWGGIDASNNYLNTGGRYNPGTDSWIAISTINAPEARYFHAAVWSGSEMIVWGGNVQITNSTNTGGRYNPGTDNWTATSTDNAPSARAPRAAVWTGDELIIWGGCFYTGGYHCMNTGGRYNPKVDSWTATSTTNTPEGRGGQAAVWTGAEMIVWGGSDYATGTDFNTGGKYNPASNIWTATSMTNVPSARFRHTGAWTGTELIVWGGVTGNGGLGLTNTGGRYSPDKDSWSATTLTNAPSPRDHHTAVWTGDEMIVWGGTNDMDTDYNTGGRYCAQSSSTSTPTPSPTPTATATATASPAGTATATPSSTVSASPTATPSTTATPSASPTATPSAPPAQALNLSTRLRVLTDANVGIGGFIITGTEAKQVLLRGIGPSLSQFNVPNPLADPVLELHGPGGSTTIINDNWMDTQGAAIQATGLAPTNALESAILATLSPGAYTGILKGKNNGVGVGLVEVYDVGQAAASKLGNISTRGFVSTGADIMIAGFILGGNNIGEDNIVVRGLGPSLAAFGIPGVLANPQLELRDSSGTLIRANNDWMEDPEQKALIIAAGLAPTNAMESAIYATLAPGQYTALLSGVSNGTGVGLVEAYDLAASGGPVTTPTPGGTATPSGTPGGTPMPSPSASPSPSAAPPCTENWDSVTAPALPPGWVASSPDPGDGVLWVTTTAVSDSAPNNAFIPVQDGISDKVLDRTGVNVTSASAQLSFRNNFNTGFSPGPCYDGYVLEVSAPNISGGDFLDITDVGGTFVTGGYTCTIDGQRNPLAGRMAWSGNSNGYIDAVINLGPNLAGQTVTFRFRMGTDEAVAFPGVHIDNLVFTGASCP